MHSTVRFLNHHLFVWFWCNSRLLFDVELFHYHTIYIPFIPYVPRSSCWPIFVRCFDTCVVHLTYTTYIPRSQEFPDASPSVGSILWHVMLFGDSRYGTLSDCLELVHSLLVFTYAFVRCFICILLHCLRSVLRSFHGAFLRSIPFARWTTTPHIYNFCSILVIYICSLPFGLFVSDVTVSPAIFRFSFLRSVTYLTFHVSPTTTPPTAYPTRFLIYHRYKFSHTPFPAHHSTFY